MTVAELIDKLNLVKDKNQIIWISQYNSEIDSMSCFDIESIDDTAEDWPVAIVARELASE